jgi:hypothetical protein
VATKANVRVTPSVEGLKTLLGVEAITGREGIRRGGNHRATMEERKEGEEVR